MANQITPNPSVPSQVVQEVKFPQFVNNLGIIPTSYKDSMSYYECLTWLCKYLEETVIPTVNQNGDAVEELQGLYIELNSYVDHYFENLDVQEEINNKLDRMAENGTLGVLIGRYINPLIDAQNIRINNLSTQIQSVASGSPLVASSTSEMTDTTRVYVNTTNGYWYYYDGTTWQQGGVYQASEDSETLTDLVEDYENYKEKTVEISPNLFDKDLAIVGKFRRSNGTGNATEEATNSSFAYYKLNCKPGDKFIISGKSYAVLLCDENDIQLMSVGSSDSNVSNYVINISSGLVAVKYLYISFKTAAFPINTYMIIKGETMPQNYIPYGYIFNNNYTNVLRNVIENKTCYISTNGSDNSDGSYLTPFKTLGKAIEEGFTNIYVASGIYDESDIIIENKNDIRIECYNGIATFNNGEKLTISQQGNILECDKSFDSSTNWYKYFIANNINATHNSGGGTPQSASAQNIGLFEINSDYNNSHTLSIANSLSSCEETTGSFYYDGDTIYINPIHYDENTDYYISVENGVTTDDKNGLYFSNIKNLSLYNLKTTFTYNSGFYFDNCSNINCENCEVEYSVAYSGFKLNNSSGNFRNCKVERSHVDGFGISGGNYYSNFYNCESQYNLDDGISHHDNTFGEIVGGNFHHNSKGGVSPSHGARVNCYNIISHHNAFGLYCVAQRYLGRNQIIDNCVCYSNATGLRVDGFHVLSYNCKFTNNTTPTVIADNVNTSYTEL